MAIDSKYYQGPGGFYDVTDGSGPYAIDSAGDATLIGAGGGGGGTTGGLTNAQLRAAPVPITPVFASWGVIGVSTAAAGATYARMPTQVCKQLTITNNTGAAVEITKGGAGEPYPIVDLGTQSFFALTNANEIYVRRVDQSNDPVRVSAVWES